MEIQHEKKLNRILLLGICFFLGCASASKSHTWKDVNRVVEPKQYNPQSEGHLIVYTEKLDESTSEDSCHSYSPYTIFTEDGKKFRYVENHSSREDRYPEQVSLAPGKYVIVSNKLPKQIVGAIMEDHKSTEVQLEDAR